MTESIRTRKVFYISGYDPRGAAFYHRLYRTQAAEQTKVSGLSLKISGRHRRGTQAQGWDIQSRDGEGAEALVKMEFLCWDDIIRARWESKPAGTFVDLGCVIRTYLLSGLARRIWRASPGVLATILYPLVLVLLTLLLAPGIGYGVYAVASSALPGAWAPLAAALGILAATATLKGGWMLGKRGAAFWLLRGYAFSARWARGEVPELEQRMDDFAARIAQALREADADEEVLVVGHSLGTAIAVPTVVRALREFDTLPPGRLTLITLGEVIPLISFAAEAEPYRAELQALANDERVLWVDYTAPTDALCFPLLDFVAASGLETQPGRGPKLLSPRFFKLYAPARYRKLRLDLHTMHGLYLIATDLPGAYDYFAITAGPQSLHERYAGV